MNRDRENLSIICEKRIKDYPRLLTVSNKRDKTMVLSVLCNKVFDKQEPDKIKEYMDNFLEIIHCDYSR